MAQRVKHLPGMRETQVRSLGQEDPLEKEVATHSSTLAWRIPWTEDPGGLQPMRLQRVRQDLVTNTQFVLRLLYGISLFMYFISEELKIDPYC